MNKLRIPVMMFVLAAAILACGQGGAPAASGDNVATAVAATMQALTAAAPAATALTEAPQATAVQGVPVTYKNISFVIPSGLATDALPQTVEAATQDTAGPWGVAPQHFVFLLNNYAITDGFSEVKIKVFPAQDYANANFGASMTLQRLQALLGSPSMAVTTKNLPQVPDFNAAAMIAAQAKQLDFQNGRGVRAVSQYGQAVLPIANDGTFYQFIGLTGDGKYLVIAVLPVKAPILQPKQDPAAGLPAGGVPFPDMGSSSAKDFEAYFGAVTDKLNALDSAAFQPSLATLDALVQSIKVQP